LYKDNAIPDCLFKFVAVITNIGY